MWREAKHRTTNNKLESNERRKINEIASLKPIWETENIITCFVFVCTVCGHMNCCLYTKQPNIDATIEAKKRHIPMILHSELNGECRMQWHSSSQYEEYKMIIITTTATRNCIIYKFHWMVFSLSLSLSDLFYGGLIGPLK